MSQLANYGEKYNLQWGDNLNKEQRLKVYVKGYAGGVTDVIAPPNPVVIKKEANIETFDSPFQSTLLDINFLTEEGLDFQDLIYQDERQAYVTYEFKLSGNWTLMYKCWVIPSDITEHLKASSSVFTFYASDMLGNLEHFKMEDFFNNDEEVSWEQVVDIMVQKYGLDFNFVDASGWSCTLPSFDNSVFEKLSMHSSAFFTGTGSISLKEALKTFFVEANSFISQEYGELYVINHLFYGSPSTNLLTFRRQFSQGSGNTWEANNWVKQTIGRAFVSVPTTLEPLNNETTARNTPPYQYITRSFKSPPRNIVRNGSFENDSVGSLGATYWDTYANNQATEAITVTDEQAKNDGTNSLKCEDTVSTASVLVRQDMQNGTNNFKLASANISNGNFQPDSLAETGGTTSQVTIKVNFFVEYPESQEGDISKIVHHVVLRNENGGVTTFYDPKSKVWSSFGGNILFGGEQVVFLEDNSINSWVELEIPVRYYQVSDSIHIDIYAPDVRDGDDNSAPDFNYYIDDVSMVAAPIEKGNEGAATDTNYFNVSFKTVGTDLSGEFKQEFLFGTTETVDITAKCITGVFLENDTYNLPVFKWYYEDSTTKSSESFEVMSTYHLQQLMARPIKRYQMVAYYKSITPMSSLVTATLDFSRYFEDRTMSLGTTIKDTGTGFIQLETYTVPTITSLEDPTDPDVPSEQVLAADYEGTGTTASGDVCSLLWDGNTDFNFVGGGIRSSQLLYVEVISTLDVVPNDGDFFYLGIGNFRREFTYNSSEGRVYPTGGSSINCS